MCIYPDFETVNFIELSNNEVVVHFVVELTNI